MTPEQLCKNLAAQYPSFGKKGYYSWLDAYHKVFAGVAPADLQKAYDETMRTWEGMTFPKPAHFEKNLPSNARMSHVVNHRRMFEEIDSVAADLTARECDRLSALPDWKDIDFHARAEIRRRANLEAQWVVMPRYGMEARYWRETRLTDDDIETIRQAVVSQLALNARAGSPRYRQPSFLP